MYMSDGWTFLLEICGDPPLATMGTCLVDLSVKEERAGIEPFVDSDGILHCSIGSGQERREVSEVSEYMAEAPFGGKFPFFIPASLVDFVRRFCSAAMFDGETEEGIEKLKEKYGV